MTDNEIIKALECCTKQGCSDNETKECPLKPYEDCSRRLAINALDLINRQKAEIERLALEKENLRCVIDDLSNNTEYAKSEAIREFAKRLKKKTYPFPCAIGVENAVTIRAINDLVEEMEGENG